MLTASAEKTLILKDKKITIIGAQKSGLALARLIRHFEGKIKISEQSAGEKISTEEKKWLLDNHAVLEFNGHTSFFIEDSDLIVLSPGVRFDALPVQWAFKKGIPVLGEIEFAFQFCSVPIIAVTGSNGKTTTVTLIRDLLKKQGLRPCLCGNVGSPFSEHVLDSHSYDFFVLEVSSFQLESLLDPDSPWRKPGSKDFYFKGFKPFIAIILNISENHLDRHKDREAYRNAKQRIFLNQDAGDYAILNGEDQWMKSLSAKIKPKVRFFDTVENARMEMFTNPNCTAVMEAAKILEIGFGVCREVFMEFKGVEHRLERVRTLGGIDFINDSKATTAEAVRWALNRLDQPVLMICGGRDKHIDFTVLQDIVGKKVKRMFLIGEAKEKLKKSFETVVPLEECRDLEDAIGRARKSAQPGDCVLLSPMCTSFDMFADFEERGKVFKEIVNKLH